MNCQKNNVECGGYPSPVLQPAVPALNWQTDKSRESQSEAVFAQHLRGRMTLIKYLDETTFASTNCCGIPSTSVEIALDIDIDTVLLNHFRFKLSRILSLTQGDRNPYVRFVFGLAGQREALMHALLGISGSHLASQTTNSEVEARSCYHLDFAIADLRDISQRYASTHEHVEDPAIAQALIVFLNCVITADERGAYCILLDFVRHLVVYQGASDPSFQAFLVDFIITYDVSNAIISLSHRPSLQAEMFEKARQLSAPSGVFLGVVDGFCFQLARITKMRDGIRQCRSQGTPIKGDPMILNEAASINNELRACRSGQAVGTDEHTLSVIYRQCAWVYLYRTLLSSDPDPRLSDAVDAGIAALAALKANSAAQAMLLVPLYILGCAAFRRSQRPAIDAAFGNLASYRHCANVRHAQSVVRKLWELMDTGDERSWDWEFFTHTEGLDWLVV